MNLFAVLMGGRAKGCNTELHDVVFVSGTSIEDTHARLPAKWFGVRTGLHIDAWQVIDVVDGFEVSLVHQPLSQTHKLWFVNVGGYAPDKLLELHANTFVVAETRMSAKMRGRARLKQEMTSGLHVDDVRDVDDCLNLAEVDGLHVVLTPTKRVSASKPIAAYVPLKGMGA